MKRIVSLLAMALLPVVVLGAEPQPVPGFGGAGQVGKMFAGLLLMIVVILGLAALLRRVNGIQRRLPGAIRIVSVASVGARERLLLVEVGGQQLLVGSAPGRLQTLMVLEEPVKVPVQPAGQAPTGGFAERLRDVLGSGRESRS